MDEFFQRLREIQKKERSQGGLSEVGEDFYQEVFQYLDGLMEKIGNNPFSFESYLLRDTQRIVAEICERREHKVTNSAIMNVQRSYQLFKEIKEENAPLPRNSTHEERKLYRALYSSLVDHRKVMNYPISSSTVKNRNGLKDIKKSRDNDTNVVNPIKPPESKSQSIKRPISPPSEEDILKKFGEEPRSQSKPTKSVKEPVTTVSHPLNDLGETAEDKKISTNVVIITEELPAIMGADHQVYGPFSAGDVITIPEANARILVKKQKGKLIQRYK